MRSTGNNYQITADELIGAWKVKRDALEAEQAGGQKYLPENSAVGCARCVKTKDGAGRIIECREVLPDGTIAGICDHRPLSEEEKQEAIRLRAEGLAAAREQARKTLEAKRKAEAAKQEAPKPVVIKMQCSACLRPVNSAMGWNEGDVCNLPIEDSFCTGQMVLR